MIFRNDIRTNFDVINNRKQLILLEYLMEEMNDRFKNVWVYW